MTAIAFVIVAVGSLASVACGFVLLYMAFSTSILWGLGSIFVPFVHLVFIIKFWSETKVWFLRQIGAFGVVVVGGILLVASGSSSALERTAAAPPSERQSEVTQSVNTPTPRPLPPGPAEAHDYSPPAGAPTWLPAAAVVATPSPTPEPRLEDLRERWVELTMTNGQKFAVKILAVDDKRVRVELRVGGGSITSTHQRSRIASFRLLR